MQVQARRLLAVVAIAAAATLALVPVTAGEGGITPGSRIDDFTLPDFQGRTHSLSQYKDSKGVVVIFVSTRCPVSNAYNERMVALAEEYQPRGFQFLGINANKAEAPEEMSKHAGSNGWNFPVLKDEGNKIADRLHASVTPEVFVIDPQGTLQYHGRIDDSQDPSGISSRDLRSALDAMLSGSEITKKEAKAFGCSIKRV